MSRQGSGTINASADEFEITVEGQGGHGAYPHEASDVILAMSATIMAIQQIASRRVDPLEPVVVSIGSVHSGTAANVLPGSATCIGTMRAMTAPKPRDASPVAGSDSHHDRRSIWLSRLGAFSTG